MLMWLRHLVAVLALPVTVAVVVPVWLARRDHLALAPAATVAGVAVQGIGVALLAIGVALFAASLHHFAVRGRGTLAPWDPPKHLVVSGPYRYVRNPMIAGVLFVLFGEALVLQSRPQLAWATTFLVINLIYIPLLEEPLLLNRFGEAYRRYRRHVWMFLPRLRPWSSDDQRSAPQ